MKKFTVLLFILSFTMFSLCAFENSSTLFNQLSEKEMNILKKGESIEARTNRGQSVCRLAPADSEAYKIALEASKAQNHSFTVGVLQFIEYPEDFEGLSKEEIMLDVYNRMLKVSTMKGIDYCSDSAGNKMKTLFSDAYLISEPKKRSVIADPVVTALVSSAQYFAYIADTKFGGNIYTADYKVLDDEMLIEVTNYDKIKYLGIKCIDAKELHMYIDVKFMEDGIAVCSFAVAYDTEVSVKAFVTTVWLDGAYIGRIKSLRDWFIKSMAE